MLSIKSLSDPAIPAPGVRPRAMKTSVHTKTGTLMTTAAFFVTAGRKKQPKYSPADEEINEMWTICAIYVIWNWKDEIQRCPWNHYAKWKEPVPKDHRKCPEEATTGRDEVSGCLGLTAKEYRVSFRGDQNVCDSTVETAARLQESIKATGPCNLNR